MREKVVVEELYSGRARICREPEEDNYFEVYGTPEGYENAEGIFITPEQEREDIINLIDREGIWCYFAQVKCACCGQWETVDSIGMVIGSLEDSGYREDFISEIKNNLE